MCFQTIKQLQVLLAEKLDTASHNLSLKASDLFDSDTMNLQKVRCASACCGDVINNYIVSNVLNIHTKVF